MSSPRKMKLADNIKIRVSADSATETFIIDNRNDELKARGVGNFTTSQRPGTYKFKFRTGTNIQFTKQVIPRSSASKTIRAPSLEFSSPAVLEGTSRTHEYHIDKATPLSRQVHKQLGTGSQLFLFTRAWTKDGSLGGHDPAVGLTLHDLRGNLLVNFAEDGVREVASATISQFDPWAACNIAINPGSYRLRLQTLDWGTIERIVVASPRWQTQVFLLQSSSDNESQPSSFRPDLANAALLLAPIGKGFRFDNPAFRLCEIARGALEDHRCTLAHSLLKRSFDDDNPMLGIYCASVLLTADKPDRRLLSKTLKKLRHLLPSHPDVEAMALALNDRQGVDSKLFLATPPMLRSSWSLLVQKTIEKPFLIPYFSLSTQVSTHLWGDGIWLTWLTDQLEDMEHHRPLPLAKVLKELLELTTDLEVSANHGYGMTRMARELNLNNYEEALFAYLVQDQSSLDVLVKGLRVPPAAIHAIAESLMMKLGGADPDPLSSAPEPLPSPPYSLPSASTR